MVRYKRYSIAFLMKLAILHPSQVFNVLCRCGNLLKVDYTRGALHMLLSLVWSDMQYSDYLQRSALPQIMSLLNKGFTMNGQRLVCPRSIRWSCVSQGVLTSQKLKIPNSKDYSILAASVPKVHKNSDWRCMIFSCMRKNILAEKTMIALYPSSNLKKRFVTKTQKI